MNALNVEAKLADIASASITTSINVTIFAWQRQTRQCQIFRVPLAAKAL